VWTAGGQRSSRTIVRKRSSGFLDAPLTSGVCVQVVRTNRTGPSKAESDLAARNQDVAFGASLWPHSPDFALSRDPAAVAKAGPWATLWRGLSLNHSLSPPAALSWHLLVETDEPQSMLRGLSVLSPAGVDNDTQPDRMNGR
jgi:hypothetical protein